MANDPTLIYFEVTLTRRSDDLVGWKTGLAQLPDIAVVEAHHVDPGRTGSVAGLRFEHGTTLRWTDVTAEIPRSIRVTLSVPTLAKESLLRETEAHRIEQQAELEEAEARRAKQDVELKEAEQKRKLFKQLTAALAAVTALLTTATGYLATRTKNNESADLNACQAKVTWAASNWPVALPCSPAPPSSSGHSTNGAGGTSSTGAAGTSSHQRPARPPCLLDPTVRCTN